MTNMHLVVPPFGGTLSLENTQSMSHWKEDKTAVRKVDGSSTSSSLISSALRSNPKAHVFLTMPVGYWSELFRGLVVETLASSSSTGSCFTRAGDAERFSLSFAAFAMPDFRIVCCWFTMDEKDVSRAPLGKETVFCSSFGALRDGGGLIDASRLIPRRAKRSSSMAFRFRPTIEKGAVAGASSVLVSIFESFEEASESAMALLKSSSSVSDADMVETGLALRRVKEDCLRSLSSWVQPFVA